MKLAWTPEAVGDRQAIWDFIASDNAQAAARIDILFSEASTLLEAQPRAGRPGLVTGTRELIPHENYRLVYEIRGDTIWVLALVHTSRQWPPPEHGRSGRGRA